MLRAEVYGEWLRMARRRKDLTQPRLAAKVGVGRNTVSRWENGRHLPPPSRRQSIERVLGPYPDRETGGVAEEALGYAAGSSAAIMRLSPDELRIISIYRWLVGQSEDGRV
jgi:transcriptional regulator with XRE-family HTH domain